MKIEEIDKNFVQSTDSTGFRFINCLDLPQIQVTGLPWMEENGNFHRLPDRLVSQYSEGIQSLRKHTSGASLRFRTDATRLGFSVVLEEPCRMSHMAYNGIMGLDIFSGLGADSFHEGVIFAPYGGETYSGNLELHTSGMRDITVYLPLYSGVKSIEIGFPEGTTVEVPTPLPLLPVCFYGNSVTQGGCASRPGTNYCAILGRKLGFAPFNLGFSGNGKGEKLIAELIASVPLSALVMDYDHNAPSPAHLEATHHAFYQTVRAAQPKIPILMMSRVDAAWQKDPWVYREVIERSFAEAVEAGDKNVYFIDGSRIFDTEYLDCYTVDGHHPNDLGFYKIASAIDRVLAPALKNIR